MDNFFLHFCRETLFLWEATIIHSSITQALGAIGESVALSQHACRQGQQNATQAGNHQQVHRNQAQCLAQLGNRHTQLCYDFSHCDLLTADINFCLDPTCRRAIRNCAEEVSILILLIFNSISDIHTLFLSSVSGTLLLSPAQSISSTQKSGFAPTFPTGTMPESPLRLEPGNRKTAINMASPPVDLCLDTIEADMHLTTQRLILMINSSL